MSNAAPYPLFSAYGIELEYMLVDARSLDVAPLAERVLLDDQGQVTGEVVRGPTTWSNELVAHVIELKVSDPAVSFDALPGLFQSEVAAINARLGPAGARLMPTGMHPWMDPFRETALWSHDGHEFYSTFDRIFDCRGHGWGNLQSVHLNLPFAGDDEFRRLHAAVRLVLPILPALTASSPVIDARLTGLLDNRLEVYRTNAAKIPEMTGRVIPEAVDSRAGYEALILEPLYRALAPHDPQGLLRHEWANARGAIARFSRGTIEIRVMDVQECPLADVAICAAVTSVLRLLVAGRFAPLAAQQQAPVERLERILLDTVRDADAALVGDADYLSLLGAPGSPIPAGALWNRLIDGAARAGTLDPRWLTTLSAITTTGPLARRIAKALGFPVPGPVDCDALRIVYRQLCDCLATGRLFVP